MSLPRPVYPGSTLMVTRRCTQRQFLLRPDAEANKAVIYCLAVAAQRHDIEVIDFVQMSNHLHHAFYDRHGNAPAFYEDFHRLLAKCMNALRGRWENFFSSEQVCVVRLENTEDVVGRLVYIATNPVKDGLVARVDEWPGASGHRALLRGETMRATRPASFFAKDGSMPEEVALRLTVPPELGDRDAILEEVRRRVAAVETQQAEQRAKDGKHVVGRCAVLRQPWHASPTSHEPRRNLRPIIAARSLWARLEAIQRKREFVAAYRRAWQALVAGTPCPFPPGTYWLRRFLHVDVAAGENLN